MPEDIPGELSGIPSELRNLFMIFSELLTQKEDEFSVLLLACSEPSHLLLQLLIFDVLGIWHRDFSH